MADHIHKEKQEAFLAAFVKCGNVSGAAKLAGINRRSHLNWMKKDPTYPERFEEAKEEACDAIDAEIRRRAIDGWKEPVFGSGGKDVGTVRVGTIRKYSDSLLIFYAKGAMPDKYRERQSIEHSGGMSQEIRVVTDPDWYGNESRLDDAETLAAPDPSLALAGPDEAVGLRAPLVEDLGGLPGGDEGARADAGPLQGSDQRGANLVGGAELPADASE